MTNHLNVVLALCLLLTVTVTQASPTDLEHQPANPTKEAHQPSKSTSKAGITTPASKSSSLPAKKTSYQAKVPVEKLLFTVLSRIDKAVDKYILQPSWKNLAEDVKDRMKKTKLSTSKKFKVLDCTEIASGIHDLQCRIEDKKYTLLRFQFTSHDELLPKGKRNLYIFIYASGKYLGANFTGEVQPQVKVNPKAKQSKNIKQPNK